MRSTLETTAKRGPYRVSAITQPDGEPPAYAVVSPSGDPLSPFSDSHAALEEASVLNEAHSQRVSPARNTRSR